MRYVFVTYIWLILYLICLVNNRQQTFKNPNCLSHIVFVNLLPSLSKHVVGYRPAFQTLHETITLWSNRHWATATSIDTLQTKVQRGQVRLRKSRNRQQTL